MHALAANNYKRLNIDKKFFYAKSIKFCSSQSLKLGNWQLFKYDLKIEPNLYGFLVMNMIMIILNYALPFIEEVGVERWKISFLRLDGMSLEGNLLIGGKKQLFQPPNTAIFTSVIILMWRLK